ncbi:hypothetical protein NXH64_08445 [Butyrivibrio fibrisolvens]|uniref:hypothetical protein n=1 Tax=Pseudobutyrivibrio ruminis TaxID=46206 RepID=UPI000567EBE0|nr:hypothetical protein [Pseudobutyrivibrio ruminis]MDC7279529.1 hypothetical protein [Butyrivibrio fibrisolvens]
MNKKLTIVGSYLIVLCISLIVFWVSYHNGTMDAMGYSIIFFWGVIPILIFINSFIIGKHKEWGLLRWLMSVPSGIMYMLASYATFSLANNIMFNKVNSPDFTIFFAGLIISLLGMVIGYLRSVNSKRKSL